MTFNVDHQGVITPSRPLSEGHIGSPVAAKRLYSRDSDMANVSNFVDMIIVSGQTIEQHQRRMLNVFLQHSAGWYGDPNYFQGCARKFPLESSAREIPPSKQKALSNFRNGAKRVKSRS